MASTADLERGFWTGFLGLTPTQAAKYSLADLKSQGFGVSPDSKYSPYGIAVGRGLCTVPVSPRAHAAFDNQDLVSTSITYRVFMPIIDASVSSILPVFGNGQSINGQGGEGLGTQYPITVAAAIETSDGAIVPFTFNGQHTITIPASSLAVPDMPLSFGAQVVANDKFAAATLTGVWMRTYVSVPGPRVDAATTTSGSSVVGDVSIVAGDAGKYVVGAGIPSGSYVGAVTPGTSFVLMALATAAAINATVTGTPNITLNTPIPLNLGPLAQLDNLTTGAAGDLTLPLSGNVSGGAGSYLYGPVAVLARTKTRKPIVGLISDSILDGYGEDFHSAFYGPVARGCQVLGLPLVKASRGGEAAGQVSSPLHRKIRGILLDGCTHVIVGIGTNDGLLNGAVGLGQLQTKINLLGTYINTLGAKAYLCTVPPRTTSTDAWATTGNQTPVSGSQITYLQQFNDWVRALPTPFVGIYDMADDCMSARNSGLWAPGLTSDGVHPVDSVMRGAMSINLQTLLATMAV